MTHKSKRPFQTPKGAGSLPRSESTLPATITRISIEDLKTDPRNPRVHSQRQIAQLEKSIQNFGFLCPVLIDETRRVLAGHGRIEAAKQLGIQEVPTISIHHLSESQRRAFMIADNRLAEQASWDKNLLAEQLKELLEVDLDFDLEATGFEVAEIDVLIEGGSPEVKGNSDPADDLPESKPVGVTKAGDLWLAGPHRIYCGNSVNSESYSLLMESRRAAIVVIDPPCNSKTGVNVDCSQIPSDEMTAAEFTSFLAQVMQGCALHCFDGSLLYAFTDWQRMQMLLAAGKQSHSELFEVCVWVKTNGGRGSPYRSQHELIFVFKKEGHCHGLQTGQHGRSRTNVWYYGNADPRRRSKGKVTLPASHPPTKPVALIADAIMDCTSLRDVVLDPFLGSGTTVIAAELAGRLCYGTELDPKNVDTIIRRWQSFTGLFATLEGSGRTFAELEQEAGNEQQG